MKAKFIKGLAMVGILVGASSTAAYASTTYSNYSTTVGRFNGNGYTSYQKKTYDGKNGDIHSENVGGKYKVDVRMQSDNGNGGWRRDVDDGTKATLPGTGSQTKGTNVRAQFSNDWNTPVAVQVDGSWRCN